MPGLHDLQAVLGTCPDLAVGPPFMGPQASGLVPKPAHRFRALKGLAQPQTDSLCLGPQMGAWVCLAPQTARAPRLEETALGSYSPHFSSPSPIKSSWCLAGAQTRPGQVGQKSLERGVSLPHPCSAGWRGLSSGAGRCLQAHSEWGAALNKSPAPPHSSVQPFSPRPCATLPPHPRQAPPLLPALCRSGCLPSLVPCPGRGG